MILAAGRGERMGPLTDAQPKPLLTIGGMALIEHHVARLTAFGFHEIVINLSYRGAQIRDYLGDGGRSWAAACRAKQRTSQNVQIERRLTARGEVRLR